ncbi:MAG: gamma-glutamylcyclotransferase [Kofleriaceae bacterium]|nr:MAG: gamma-glutamylcyclotransferase [Kofleriaceae bacterium]MBZ0234723.1 gamma-glutamylcyclotransferase [Kofleriaceae bacterium]
MLDRMFVYGTLRRGERAWCQLEPYATAFEPARCRGTMVAFAAGYPGLLLEGDTPIAGELVTLRDVPAALAWLDDYEGDEFTRREIAVDTAAGPARAWVYAVDDRAIIATGAPVPGGDWVAYRLGTQPPIR